MIAWSGSRGGQAFADFVTPIGTIWVNALRMTVVPLVASLLIATLASGGGARSFGGSGAGRSSCFCFPARDSDHRHRHGSAALLAADRGSGRGRIIARERRRAVAGADTRVRPVDHRRRSGERREAAADGAMLPIIVFASLLGLGLARASETSSRLVTFYAPSPTR